MRKWRCIVRQTLGVVEASDGGDKDERRGMLGGMQGMMKGGLLSRVLEWVVKEKKGNEDGRIKELLLQRKVLAVLDGKQIFVTKKNGEKRESLYWRKRLVKGLMDLGHERDDAWKILILWDKLTDGGEKSIYDGI